MFEPFESRQQAKCACCRLKGGPDALLWGIRGGLRGHLGKIRRYWGREIVENLCLGFGCWGKDFFAKVSAYVIAEELYGKTIYYAILRQLPFLNWVLS